METELILDLQKLMEEFCEEMKEFQEEVKGFREEWKSQADSTGDDTGEDESLTLFDDGAGEDDSHFSNPSDDGDPDDDFNDDGSNVLSRSEFSEDEYGSNAKLDETEVVVLKEAIEPADRRNQQLVTEKMYTTITPKLFDESPKKETTLAAPSYVQIADMEMKQHFLVQEQQLWQQYANNGMQGRVGEGEVPLPHLTLEVLNVISLEERKRALRRLRLNVLIFDPGGGAISLSALILRYANCGRINYARRILHIKSDPCIVLCNPIIIVLVSLLNGNGSTKLEMIATVVVVAAVNSIALEGSKETKAAMQITTMKSMINKTPDSPMDDLTLMKETLKVKDEELVPMVCWRIQS